MANQPQNVPGGAALLLFARQQAARAEIERRVAGSDEIIKRYVRDWVESQGAETVWAAIVPYSPAQQERDTARLAEMSASLDPESRRVWEAEVARRRAHVARQRAGRRSRVRCAGRLKATLARRRQSSRSPRSRAGRRRTRRASAAKAGSSDGGPPAPPPPGLDSAALHDGRRAP